MGNTVRHTILPPYHGGKWQESGEWVCSEKIFSGKLTMLQWKSIYPWISGNHKLILKDLMKKTQCWMSMEDKVEWKRVRGMSKYDK